MPLWQRFQPPDVPPDSPPRHTFRPESAENPTKDGRRTDAKRAHYRRIGGASVLRPSLLRKSAEKKRVKRKRLMVGVVPEQFADGIVFVDAQDGVRKQGRD